MRARRHGDGALADYTEAIRLKPDFADAYCNRGADRSDQGDLDGALADFDEAIRLKPNDANAYNNRGYARQVKGDYSAAISDYQRVGYLLDSSSPNR